MARCKNCGKVNRDGARFCQDCGRPVDGVGAIATANSPPSSAAAGEVSRLRSPEPPKPASSKPAGDLEGNDGPACESCGVANAANANFCRACGANLGVLRGSAGAGAGRVSCAQCGQLTPAGFSFCQHCGGRLGEGSSRSLGGGAGPVRAARPEVPSTELPPPSYRSAGSAAAGGVPAVQEATARPVAVRPSGGVLKGRLIVLKRDGSDGESITLSGETFDIGRSATSKAFPDDPFLAPRHVRFLAHAGGVRVRPLDNVNGVFVQIREPYELQSGDVFYIGRELIRFEMLGSDERDLAPIVEHGVRMFGTTPRESWGRLRQLTTAAVVRDVWHLSRAEILLGREEGDIVFPDDEFMSRRHALLSRLGARVRLEDQHSSNGTYVRLRGDRDVQPSDVLRVGDQVLRFET